MGLASILLREGHLDDTVVVIKKALEVRQLFWPFGKRFYVILKYENMQVWKLFSCIHSLVFLCGIIVLFFAQISPSLALGHFILGNVFGAQVTNNNSNPYFSF